MPMMSMLAIRWSSHLRPVARFAATVPTPAESPTTNAPAARLRPKKLAAAPPAPTNAPRMAAWPTPPNKGLPCRMLELICAAAGGGPAALNEALPRRVVGAVRGGGTAAGARRRAHDEGQGQAARDADE